MIWVYFNSNAKSALRGQTHCRYYATQCKIKQLLYVKRPISVICSIKVRKNHGSCHQVKISTDLLLMKGALLSGMKIHTHTHIALIADSEAWKGTRNVKVHLIFSILRKWSHCLNLARIWLSMTKSSGSLWIRQSIMRKSHSHWALTQHWWENPKRISTVCDTFRKAWRNTRTSDIVVKLW